MMYNSLCYWCFCFRYVFPCKRWLPAGKEDHLLPVAAHEDLTTFGNIFFSDTRKRLTDSHLWISVLSRSTKSNFTQVQRVSCIFSLLMMSMLVSAMFHQVADVATNAQGYTLGPLKFTLHEVYISIVSSVLVFPVSLLTDQLFRRSKVGIHVKDDLNSPKQPSSAWSLLYTIFRNLSRLCAYRSMQLTTLCSTIYQHTEIAEYHQKTKMLNEVESSFKYQKMKNILTSSDSSVSSLKLDAQSTNESVPRNDSSFSNLSNVHTSSANIRESCPSQGRLMLPHWCVYVAWGLVVLTSALSGSLTLLLSLQWGRERSLAWLTSTLLAVLESIMIMQPMKVSSTLNTVWNYLKSLWKSN